MCREVQSSADPIQRTAPNSLKRHPQLTLSGACFVANALQVMGPVLCRRCMCCFIVILILALLPYIASLKTLLS